MSRPIAWAGIGIGRAFSGAVVLLGWATGAHAQTTIIGRVIAYAGRGPVASATVLVTGTTVSTATTSRGTFTLRLPADARSLTVRGPGFLATVVPIAADVSDYTIALHQDVLGLEAPVATGIATTISAASAATSIAVVPGQAINEVPTPTVEQAMEGLVPGALLQQNNGGAPGGGAQAQIRGITSLSGNGSPLYVLDGIVLDNETIDPGLGVNRIADLNPADIESVQVLKGASASGIYGAQGSAGVIIITTRQGTAGKPRWNLSQKIGQFSDAQTLGLRSFPTLSSAQAWYVNDYAHDTGAAIAAGDAYIASIYAGPRDYQSQLFSNGQASYETDLSVDGTQGRTQYFVSGLTKYDNGIMLNTGYTKQSVRANVTQRIYSALSLSASLNYVHDDTRRGITGNDASAVSPYLVFSYTPQFLNLDHRNPDGSWTKNPIGLANPFADAIEIATPQTLARLIGGGSANWMPWKTDHQSLQIALTGGVDRSNLHDLLYAPSNLQFEAMQALPGEYVTNHAAINYSNYSANVIHHFTMAANVDFTTSLGSEWNQRDLTNPVTVAVNLLSGVNPPTGSVQDQYYYSATQHNQILYGQEQIIALNSRVTLAGGVTAERSTLDGAVNRYYAYPRVAASYRIPQLLGFLDDLTLRGAYGESGSLPAFGDRFSPYPYTSIGGAGGIGSAGSSSSDIKPETEHEIELGFDAAMFKERAQLSAAIYQKRISDLVVAGSSQFINGGEFTNSGVELSLTLRPIQHLNGFTWTSTETYYRNYSVVNSLPVPPFSFGGNAPGASTWMQPGRSVSQLADPGIQTSNGEALQVGDFEPSYVLSSSQDLTWSKFRLYGLLDWQRGGTVANISDFIFDAGPHLLADTAASVRRLANYFAGSGFAYLEPATFIKVRALSLSYLLPSQWLNWTTRAGLHLSTARLSLEARNLLAWYSKSYTGLDPEVSSSGGQTPVRGFELAPYPPSRSYFLSLDLAF